MPAGEASRPRPRSMRWRGPRTARPPTRGETAAAGAQPRGAPQMGREVAVAQAEPGGQPEPAQGHEARERVAREAPPAAAGGEAGERVDDGVEVGRDVEPEELLVVTGVADDGEAPRVSAPDEARKEPGRAHATRQHRDPHGSTHPGARPVLARLAPRPHPSGRGRRASCVPPGRGPWRAPAPRSPRPRCTRPP